MLRLIAPSSKQNEAGLLLARVLALFDFILVGEVRECVFFGLPGQPGRIVVVAAILRRLLNGLDLAIELQRQMGVQRIRKDGDNKLEAGSSCLQPLL